MLDRGARVAGRPGAVTVIVAVGLVGAAVFGGCGPAPVATPDPLDRLAATVTPARLGTHLDALDAIAAEHGGQRAVGFAGYDASVDYAAGILEGAGFSVGRVASRPWVFEDLGGSELAIEGADGATFRDGADFLAYGFSPAGSAAGPLEDVGDGCDEPDFTDVGPGEVALVSDLACWGDAQARLGEFDVGAIVVQGPALAAAPLLRLGGPPPPAPTIVVTGAVASELRAAGAGGADVRVVTDTAMRQTTADSLVAELAGRDPDRVVMLGAHLDSTIDGPGINDDGSGVAALLAIAEALGGTRPEATVRIALWAGEEVGLVGSAAYVDALDATERAAIVAYLNADMIGSPNGRRGVYAPTSPAEEPLAARIAAAFERRGLASAEVDIGGGSDHVPFRDTAIPVGGVFAGGAAVKSEDDAAVFGGTAGDAEDPCYHLACDDRANVDTARLAELAGVLGEVAVELAYPGPVASPGP